MLEGFARLLRQQTGLYALQSEGIWVPRGGRMRSEQTLFDELARLCTLPGYVHAIAYLCYRDNMIMYSGEIKVEDMQHLFSKSRLIRTETSTLIGLMLKSPIDYILPAPPVLEKYIESTEALLEEIHHAMTASFWQDIDPAEIAEEGFNPFTNGPALRKPIFYVKLKLPL